MNILILGGTGLISTRITQQLLARGDQVTHVNRGNRAIGFGGIAFDRPIDTMVCDRTRHAEFESRMREAPKFDCVIDMIGYAPEDAASAIRAFGGRCGQFIFCSTVDVYAHPAARLPYTEDAARHGLNQYAADKVLCEQALEAAHARGELVLTLIRPAATYAEGGTVLHSFGGKTTYIDRLRKGKPVIVHGDGQSLWCMCHADDVARAFIGAVGNPRTAGRGYHATGPSMTWNDYHATVAEAIGAPAPELVHIPTDALTALLPSQTLADRAHWIATNFQYNNLFDNTAAERDLGFQTSVTWREGAARLVGWLDAHGEIEDSDLNHFDDNLIAAWRRALDHLREDWTKTGRVRERGNPKRKPARRRK